MDIPDPPDPCRYCGTLAHDHALWCPFHDGEPDWMDQYVDPYDPDPDPYDTDRAQDRYDRQVYGP